jgi:hypothetical protein
MNNNNSNLSFVVGTWKEFDLGIHAQVTLTSVFSETARMSNDPVCVELTNNWLETSEGVYEPNPETITSLEEAHASLVSLGLEFNKDLANFLETRCGIVVYRP